jgi:hypothetical protein
LFQRCFDFRIWFVNCLDFFPVVNITGGVLAVECSFSLLNGRFDCLAQLFPSLLVFWSGVEESLALVDHFLYILCHPGLVILNFGYFFGLVDVFGRKDCRVESVECKLTLVVVIEIGL